VGQIYLCDNPLLKRPLAPTDVKDLILGHWGTTPGQNFIYVHLNRVIRKLNLDMIDVCGPGHGGPAVVANTYLQSTYSEVYPDVSRDQAGLKRLFTQFSFHLVIEAIDRVPCAGERGRYLEGKLQDKLVEHRAYINQHGRDLPEVRDWKWSTRA
jgi:phosphoketolase